MKLFYTPGACSLAVHIALREVGATFDASAVDLATHKTADERIAARPAVQAAPRTEGLAK